MPRVITIDDKKVRDTLGRIKDNLPKFAHNSARDVAKMYAERIKFFAMPHNYTGRLAASLTRQMNNPTKSEHGYAITAPASEGDRNVPYLNYISSGTRLHLVSLKAHPALKEYLESKGKDVRGKTHWVMGSRKHRIVQKGISSGHRHLEKILKQKTNRFIKSRGKEA